MHVIIKLTFDYQNKSKEWKYLISFNFVFRWQRAARAAHISIVNILIRAAAIK